MRISDWSSDVCSSDLRGTDVAREASSIVLVEDDFGAIVSEIRLGRRIYDNIRKAIGYIFAVHVPIAGLALLPLLLGRSEEHTSELQSLMRISSAAFCLNKTKLIYPVYAKHNTSNSD